MSSNIPTGAVDCGGAVTGGGGNQDAVIVFGIQAHGQGDATNAGSAVGGLRPLGDDLVDGKNHRGQDQ